MHPRLAVHCDHGQDQNVAESLLELGEVHDAAAFIDPITDRGTEPVVQAYPNIHGIRAQLDMLRGAAAAAGERWADIRAVSSPALAYEANTARWEVELHLWQGDDRAALDRVRFMLQRLADAEGGNARNQFLLSGCPLLLLAYRAVADLAEQGRVQHSEQAIADTRNAAVDLEAVRRRIQPRPFDADDPRPEAPAEMWRWRAELSRAENNSDATLWGLAAETWDELGRPHRAAYAHWRQAEALLATPDGRSAASPILRRAAQQAVQHAPLAAAIGSLARRARIELAELAPSLQARQADADPDVRVDRPGVGRAAAARAGQVEPGDRRHAVHQPEDGQRARDQHSAQTRCHDPGAGGDRRRACRPAPRRPGAADDLRRYDARSCRCAYRRPNRLRPGAGRRWSRWVGFWREPDRRDVVAASHEIEPVTG